MALIYIPLAWVRKIHKFAFAFVLATILIALSTIVISWFCIDRIIEIGPGPGVVPINYPTMWDVVGFSVYTYEGIGVVMPIMSTCNCPEKFPVLLLSAVALLTTIYILFGELCYYTFGSGLNEPIVMQMMPAANPIIITVKILFIINLLCSYPLTLYPVNLIFESYVYKNFKEKSFRRTVYKNITRALFVLVALYLAIELASKLDKFLSLLGALLCAPLAFTMPTLCHLKLCAKTKRDKIIDISIVVFSFVILVFCTIQSIESWNK